ncbi:retron St85 family RNA-directed DNA polymerase [Acidithiobacillus ferriphilus]|uniref:retron St85 family RNA-directed DNA polymerase n=1 Tax=Acidithiobacillus ferriphilus TaxID=1689834 RepID=UPI00390CBB81
MSFRSTDLFTRLLKISPLSIRELSRVITTAPHRYKTHYIEKRHGRGKRLISQPTAELKYFQRWLVDNELNQLPVHDAAMAYRRKRSILDHASPHSKQRYLLKVDFKDFFPSLNENSLRHCLNRDRDYSEEELTILCNLLLKSTRIDGMPLQLSIGAPSSPFISNYLMWEFDTKIQQYCDVMNVTYTRYADDLAFSTNTPRLLDQVLGSVQKVLASISYLPLILNPEKTVNVSKKRRRLLVGLTLANDGNVSIGRNEKRRLRAALHAHTQGQLSRDEVARLVGILSFVWSIDPSFVETLCQRHGYSGISDLL